MLYEEVLDRVASNKHDQILLVFNSSPALLNPSKLYETIDKILQNFQSRFGKKANATFSSLNNYVKSVQQYTGIVDWQVFNNDFFPDAEKVNEWRSGVSSTRSSLKKEIREFSQFTSAAN